VALQELRPRLGLVALQHLLEQLRLEPRLRLVDRHVQHLQRALHRLFLLASQQESNIHKFQLDYENTILHYWVFTNDRLSGLKHIIN
jgi:hypothetical protein